MANGGVDPKSLAAQASAKNVLTVGASENDRASDYACDTSLGYTTCAAQGGQNGIFTYGSAWPTELPGAAAEHRPERRQRGADGRFQQPGARRRRPHQARRGGPRNLGALDLLRSLPAGIRPLPQSAAEPRRSTSTTAGASR